MPCVRAGPCEYSIAIAPSPSCSLSCARAGYTLVGLLFAITLVALLLGLVVAVYRLSAGVGMLDHVAISADGSTAVITFVDGTLGAYDMNARASKLVRTAATGYLLDARLSVKLLSADGHRLVLYGTSNDSTAIEIEVWDIAQARLVRRMPLKGVSTPIGMPILSPDGTELMVVQYFGPTTIIDLETGAEFLHFVDARHRHRVY